MYHWLGKWVHNHKYEIHYTMDEMWIQCECGQQQDIPPEREEEAYEKIRNKDLSWKETNEKDIL